MFQNITQCQKSCKNVPNRPNMFQSIPKCTKTFQNVPKLSKMSDNIRKRPKSSLNVPYGSGTTRSPGLVLLSTGLCLPSSVCHGKKVFLKYSTNNITKTLKTSFGFILCFKLRFFWWLQENLQTLFLQLLHISRCKKEQISANSLALLPKR